MLIYWKMSLQLFGETCLPCCSFNVCLLYKHLFQSLVEIVGNCAWRKIDFCTLLVIYMCHWCTTLNSNSNGCVQAYLALPRPTKPPPLKVKSWLTGEGVNKCGETVDGHNHVAVWLISIVSSLVVMILSLTDHGLDLPACSHFLIFQWLVSYRYRLLWVWCHRDRSKSQILRRLCFFF